MAELCQKAGVPKRPAHYLRHCHATLLVHLGADVKSAQRRLGHSSPSLTLGVYAHHLAEGDLRLARLLDEAFGA
jgi:integrase